jgi:hypothetical protein
MSISNQAMLVELNVGNWTANKLDKQVSDEVDASKGTRVKAGNYRKNLLAGVKELDDIKNFVGNFRNWHYKQTMPWSDSGLRLLTLKQYLPYVGEVNTKMTEFNDMKNHFVTLYPNLISQMAFQLGSLFNRDEYPSQDEIARKFYFNVNYYPLPEAGDFRVDVGNEALADLQTQYTNHYQNKLNDAMKDVWDRLHGTLKHLSERLQSSDDGTKKVFRDSLIGNATELCGMLSNLNVTNDPQLEQARKDLEQALVGVTAKDLRESVLVREDVRVRVNEILNKFDF